jgi:Protein of unknown function (DUF3180)
MRRTSVRSLALVVVLVATIGALVLRMLEMRGVHLPAVPWVEDAAILVLAGGIFWSGWAVRSYQKGRRPGLDPLRAARTFVLAKAGALTGALLTGRYLAQILILLGDLDIEAQRDKAIAAAVAALCAVILTVVGLVVEKFCELPPPSDGDEAEHRRQRETGGEAEASA